MKCIRFAGFMRLYFVLNIFLAALMVLSIEYTQPTSSFKFQRRVWLFWKILHFYSSDCKLIRTFMVNTQMLEYLRHSSTIEPYLQSRIDDNEISNCSGKNREYLPRTSFVTPGAYLKSNFVISTKSV